MNRWDYYPFAIRSNHMWGWAFRRDENGRPILRSLRIRRLPGNWGDGYGSITVVRKPPEGGNDVSGSRLCSRKEEENDHA
jgi:hypothetical protein